MKFKAKLKKIGNGIHIYIPKSVYTKLEVGNEYDWEVYTEKEPVITKESEALAEIATVKLGEVSIFPERKRFNTEMCPKHEGSMKGTCGCE